MNTNPQRMGKYELQELLGRGGMAEVWKAFDPQLLRHVAIKILHPDFLNDAAFVSRFEREAQVIASLRHPNIVQIYDFQVSRPPETSSTIAYMVMDYIEGATLANYIRKTSRIGKFPPESDIYYLFAAIGRAVDYAHQKGMIHRDIKPSNILLDKRDTNTTMGEPILSDFGIAKLMAATGATLSSTGLGTPLYLSPEQASGKIGNERSDIYSLGVVLYEVCTGVPPFRGESITAIMMQHITSPPPAPSLINPDILPPLSAVIVRCLAKDPTMRFSSAAAMVAALADAFDMSIAENAVSPPYAIKDMSKPTFLPHAPNPPSSPGIAAISSPPQQALALSTPPSAQLPISDHGIPIDPMSDPGKTSFVNSGPFEVDAGLPTPVPSQPQLPGAITPVPAPATPRPTTKRSRRGWFIGLVSLLILVLLGSILGAVYWFTSGARTTPAAVQVGGHVYFISSGQISERSSQGINDQLVIDLHNLSTPAAGKSYYAWLLSDSAQTEGTPIFITKLAVVNGNAHFFYQGNQNHTNLLAVTSRFLVTEEDANIAPNSPSLDQKTWRYYAALPQKPDPLDTVDHYSVLNHLRHLLAEDPTLHKVGLPGGLDIWLFRNTEKVLEWAGSARDSWERSETISIRNQVIRILDYLDGLAYVQQDVPPGTPILVNPKIAPVALLEFDALNQNPPGYLFHVSKHLRAITQSPGATANQHKLAETINNALNEVQGWLDQVRQDAKKLVNMPVNQLASPGALSILDDMETQARNAYIGQLDPTTNQLHDGVVQIHYDIQFLAAFDVAPFTSTS